MQAVLDPHVIGCNTKQPHRDRGMNGCTPARAFRDGIPKTTSRKGAATPVTTAA